MISIENLYFLGIGFALGVVICLVLSVFGFSIYSGRLKSMSSQALFDNSSKFMELAEKYFSGYVRAARKEFDIKGDQILKSVDPVKQAIEKYDHHMGQMERERDKAYSAIYTQLSEMTRVQQSLHLETGNLVKALRVPHVRGRWGEITLKRVAELAGMAEYCDFYEQVATGGGKGAVRPDMIVTLPGNRNIIIDSKVPLAAYLDALEAATEAEKELCLKDHSRQVMNHITGLSSKNYHKELPSSPEFVVLFIPGENFFSAALTYQPDLIEKGIKKGVILATPATLIALLKAVSHSWKQKKSYENAQEIRELGIELYSRLCSMAENMNRLGKDIEKCVATYNRTIGALEKRVLVSARRFNDLGISSENLNGLQAVETEKGVVKQLRSDEQEV